MTEETRVFDTPSFEEKSLWDKIKTVAKNAGKEVIKLVLTLYYCLIDEDGDTPQWAESDHNRGSHLFYQSFGRGSRFLARRLC